MIFHNLEEVHKEPIWDEGKSQNLRMKILNFLSSIWIGKRGFRSYSPWWYIIFFAPSISSISNFFFKLQQSPGLPKESFLATIFFSSSVSTEILSASRKCQLCSPFTLPFNFQEIARNSVCFIYKVLWWLNALSHSKKSQRFTIIVIFTLGGRKGV